MLILYLFFILETSAMENECVREMALPLARNVQNPPLLALELNKPFGAPPTKILHTV